jgi:hypothetical protein
MSSSYTEDRLIFTFDKEWKVVKWDDSGAFQHGIRKLQSTEAIDFFGLYLGLPWFVEVKDYRHFPGVARKRLSSGELAKAVAGKVRDTLSGMIWACGRAPLDDCDLRTYLRPILNRTQKVPVVLWMEEDDDVSSAALSTLAEAIKRELTWLNPQVIITNRKNKPIPGLVVTSSV